ncbi:hypothetical protein [Nitrosophilus alvini]|uniref:hypothetical protein n=1 Tax=Nitrosophilus alvini TaxID=2714855 RepID=UPI00190CC30E|nr:hypothetical protein [Nitrosophilus alvini]
MKKQKKNTAEFSSETIAVNSRYIAISDRSRSTVLLSDFNGNVKYIIAGFGTIASLLFVNEDLYISDIKEERVIRISDRFSKKSTITDGINRPFNMAFKDGILYIATADNKIFSFNTQNRKTELFAVVESKGKILMAFLSDDLYFADTEGRLCHIENEKIVIDTGDLKAGIFGGIAAGQGGCGAYRVFITDMKKGELKVFDPVSKDVRTILQNLKNPRAIAKKECDIYIAEEGTIVHLDLKSFEREELSLNYIENCKIVETEQELL